MRTTFDCQIFWMNCGTPQGSEAPVRDVRSERAVSSRVWGTKVVVFMRFSRLLATSPCCSTWNIDPLVVIQFSPVVVIEKSPPSGGV